MALLRVGGAVCGLILCTAGGLSGFQSVQTSELHYEVLRAQIRAVERQQQARERAERIEFEHKFDRLVKAASEFSEAYNAKPDEAWPEDKALELRRAMNRLHKSARPANAHSPAERADFERGFNRMARALEEFSRAYRSGTWPYGKARELHDAVEELGRHTSFLQSASVARTVRQP